VDFEMNTCDTCRWWEEFKESNGYMVELIGMGGCTNPMLCIGVGDMPSKNGLSAGEALSSPCPPETGPKFGCMHHEANMGSHLEREVHNLMALGGGKLIKAMAESVKVKQLPEG
jgi:hypothetical protein